MQVGFSGRVDEVLCRLLDWFQLKKNSLTVLS